MPALSNFRNVSMTRYARDNWLLLGMTLLAAAALLQYRSLISIELGLLGMVVDILVELRGTTKGQWRYNKSDVYDIRGRVPIEVPLMYFLMGVIGASYVLFRLA